MKLSKNRKKISLFLRVRPPETPLCQQNTEKITPRLYSRSILYGNKGPIWSISVAAMYSERKAASALIQPSDFRRLSFNSIRLGRMTVVE